MSDSGVWDLDIAGSGSGSEIENRLNTLENTIHEYEIYELISTGTAGTVTKPTHGTIILDQYPAGGDCIVVQTDSTTQKPIEALVYDASGVLVEGTLDINGNYTLSGVPAVYPVALVFQVSLAEMYKTLELSNDRILTEMRIPNAGVTSHEDLSNINQAGTGVLNGHISDQVQTIAGAKTYSGTVMFNEAVTFNSEIIQQGTGKITYTEEVRTKNDLITLREGAITGLDIGEYTGLRAKLYDGVNDGLFVIDRDGYFKVGDEGNLVTLASREDSPIDQAFGYWDDTTKIFKTKTISSSDLTDNSSIVKTSGTQTIEGAKTFSDTIIGSINGNADTVTNGVYTIDDQTITGIKTFNSSPIIPDATTATQAVSKRQLDTVDLKTTPVDCTFRVAEYTGDGGGATVKDRAGNGNNLTTTAITYVNGKYGKEMSFNGSTSYAQASSPVIGMTGTIAVRLKPSTLSVPLRPLGNRRVGLAGGISTYITATSGVFEFSLVKADGSLQTIQAGNASTSAYGVFIMSWDGATVKTYKDGTLINSVAQLEPVTIARDNLAIGRMGIYASDCFNGNISHFRYDSRIWTADEARAWSLNLSVEDSLAMSETHSAGDVMVWPSVIYNTSNRSLNGGETKVVEIYKQPKIRQISGVIRYYNDVDGSGNPGWNFINNHYALGLGLHVGATSSAVVLSWTISDFVDPRVVSFVCTPDEGYAKMGLFCGASVGRNSAYISLYAGELGDLITYNSGTGLWESHYGNITAVWKGSLLHVSISAVETGGAKFIYKNYPFPTIGNRCGAIGSVQVEGQANVGGVYKHHLSFWTHAGTQITSPQAGMRFWIKTGIPKALNPLTDFSESYSNIWFNGYIIDADSVKG